MPFCSKCGAEVLDGANFCQRCGTPVTSSGAGTKSAKKPISPLAMIGIALFAVIFACGGLFLTQSTPRSPAARTTPSVARTTSVPASLWTHTAVVRVNDEQGVPMGTDAHVWVDAFRTDLKINCAIPRGRTVEVSTQRVINDSIRVKDGSCEGWIGVIQLDKITPKN